MELNYRMVDRQDMSEILATVPFDQEFALRVTGTSMVPFLLNRRSTVFLVRQQAYTPRVGDIVFFRRLRDGSYVLHRINAIKKDKSGRTWLVINGDAQFWRETILPSQICAHVTHFIRTERDIRMSERQCRFWAAVWRPLRFIHAPVARLYYYWTRLPYKLGIKKEQPKK